MSATCPAPRPSFSQRALRAGGPRALTAVGFVLLGALCTEACGSPEATPEPEAPGTPARTCADLPLPTRSDESDCADVDASNPEALGRCLLGSGHAGAWAVDADGLPAYDFHVEERCDPVAEHWSPRSTPQRDPVHLIGNGRGLVAMAHASGGVEIYSQDRGHKWLNRVDTWADSETPSFPQQLGGGFSYVVDGDKVWSTRFEDLPLGEATTLQTRRFGAGYVETVTTLGTLRLRRRVFAPDADARALVAEVEVENLGDAERDVGLVEFWDVNLHEVPVELMTSDLSFAGITARIDRKRRALMAGFEQSLGYDAASRVATVTTRALSMPASVTTRADVSATDYFPEPLYLAALDADARVDAAWLDDRELWGELTERPIPAAVATSGDGASRSMKLNGEGQHPVLALRSPVHLGPGERSVRRFAFGYVPGGGTPDAALAELRGAPSTLAASAASSWRERLVWAAFPGLESAGAIQRELAWSSYSALANVTFDEYRGTRLLGQGGAYKYIHGLDGAIGDLALFSEAMLLIDPELARDTLSYCFASQHAGAEKTPWRYPYATTGIGSFSDVGIYGNRSDPYFLLPWSAAKYVAVSRDASYLDREVPYWPKHRGETGSVLDHLKRSLDYADTALGLGARGFVAIGTGDYADGILRLTEEDTSERGTSSLYNAGFVVAGFPLAADAVASRSAGLAARLRTLFDSQSAAFINEGWGGRWYERGFADNGKPLAPNMLFLEPQVLPILAGLVEPPRRKALLALLAERLETKLGAVTPAEVDPTGGDAGGIDRPQVGGIWPVANAWLTHAYALEEPALGWSSFVRNTLFAHATAYPDLWYGIWTGPDSYNGPDRDRPGQADAHAATALTDYPALNAHLHTSPLRALMGLLGIEGTAKGLGIAPRVPTETFSVVWPRLSLKSTASSIGGTLTASASETLELRVLLPSALRTGELVVTANGASVAATRDGDSVVFPLSVKKDVASAWSVSRR